MEFYIEMLVNDSKKYAVAADQLDTLINLIINNAKLSYDKERLTLNDDKIVMEFIKAIDPKIYEERFKWLQAKDL